MLKFNTYNQSIADRSRCDNVMSNSFMLPSILHVSGTEVPVGISNPEYSLLWNSLKYFLLKTTRFASTFNNQNFKTIGATYLKRSQRFSKYILTIDTERKLPFKIIFMKHFNIEKKAEIKKKNKGH